MHIQLSRIDEKNASKIQGKLAGTPGKLTGGEGNFAGLVFTSHGKFF